MASGIWVCIGLGWGVVRWNYLWRSQAEFRYKGVSIPDPPSLIIGVGAVFCLLSIIFLFTAMFKVVSQAMFDGGRFHRSI